MRHKDRTSQVAPEIAADGVDEYLDVFVAASRAAHDAPPGPTISFECSDRSDRWWLDLSERGGRIVSRDPRGCIRADPWNRRTTPSRCVGTGSHI